MQQYSLGLANCVCESNSEPQPDAQQCAHSESNADVDCDSIVDAIRVWEPDAERNEYGHSVDNSLFHRVSQCDYVGDADGHRESDAEPDVYNICIDDCFYDADAKRDGVRVADYFAQPDAKPHKHGHRDCNSE